MAKSKSTRNEFDFMSMVLDALGVEYEEADIKQRERWRGKVLEGWGVDYVVDDLKQFARWRQKCLEGLAKNSGGGGGESWSTLYDGTVSVELNEGTGHYTGTVPNIYTDASKIRVTYDGVTYVINKQDYQGDPFYGETGGEMILFNEYPFALKFDEENGMTLYTQDEGDSHAVKVEILESSSDCPMKMVNITVNVSSGRAKVWFSGVNDIGEDMVASDFIDTPVHGLAYDLTDSQWVVYGTDMANGYLYSGDSSVITALIFKDESIMLSGGAGVSAVTGEATVVDGVALVTGDCTVTLLGTVQ